jgi:hypothetical protein
MAHGARTYIANEMRGMGGTAVVWALDKNESRIEGLDYWWYGVYKDEGFAAPDVTAIMHLICPNGRGVGFSTWIMIQYQCEATENSGLWTAPTASDTGTSTTESI